MPSQRNPEKLTDHDYRIMGEFRHELRRFLATRARAARNAGIDPQQYQVLLVIKGKGGSASIGDIAASMLLRHHSAVELVDRMTRKKFVRRRRAQQDRRIVLVEILPRGESILRSLYISNREELSTLGRDLLHSLQRALGQ